MHVCSYVCSCRAVNCPWQPAKLTPVGNKFVNYVQSWKSASSCGASPCGVVVYCTLDLLTDAVAHANSDRIALCNKSAVLTKTILIAVLMFVLQVGISKLVVIILSGLNQTLSPDEHCVAGTLAPQELASETLSPTDLSEKSEMSGQKVHTHPTLSQQHFCACGIA